MIFLNIKSETPPNECLTSVRGGDYFGHTNRTISGRTCMRWNSQSPHDHGYGYISDQENYCRNPYGSEPRGPWCYTTDPDRRWEYCSIPLCGKNLLSFIILYQLTSLKPLQLICKFVNMFTSMFLEEDLSNINFI